jgi:hypothetical protein
MIEAAKRDGKKQMDQEPTDLDTEPYKTQNQKHHRSGPEHVSLLSRYSLQSFSFPKACGLCNVAQAGHTVGVSYVAPAQINHRNTRAARKRPRVTRMYLGESFTLV